MVPILVNDSPKIFAPYLVILDLSDTFSYFGVVELQLLPKAVVALILVFWKLVIVAFKKYSFIGLNRSLIHTIIYSAFQNSKLLTISVKLIHHEIATIIAVGEFTEAQIRSTLEGFNNLSDADKALVGQYNFEADSSNTLYQQVSAAGKTIIANQMPVLTEDDDDGGSSAVLPPLAP